MRIEHVIATDSFCFNYTQEECVCVYGRFHFHVRIEFSLQDMMVSLNRIALRGGNKSVSFKLNKLFQDLLAA